jgi:hypothetical protein
MSNPRSISKRFRVQSAFMSKPHPSLRDGSASAQARHAGKMGDWAIHRSGAGLTTSDGGCVVSRSSLGGLLGNWHRLIRQTGARWHATADSCAVGRNHLAVVFRQEQPGKFGLR